MQSELNWLKKNDLKNKLQPMKKSLLVLFLTTLAFFGKSQDDIYLKLRKIITETHPEISLENKLIAYNVWSVDNAESREANKGFEKAYKVYEWAKLKGGLKGIVVVAINKDNLTSTASIAFSKDGLSKSISIKYEDVFDGKSTVAPNAVYDASGKIVFTNLNSQSVYSSINSLITR